MDRMKTRAQRKNQLELPFSEPQSGPAREATSLERQQRIVKAVRDFYRRSGK
jgi:hypothetical protein